MRQQYLAAKAAHPGMLLLFRMGDFYELFDDDAEVASRLLGIALTSRDKSTAATPMAGFPHHALETHLRKLLHAGLRVAVCDQVEEASQAKGIVRREVTRVVTPGTVTEDELLDPRKPNHLVAVITGKGAAGLAWVDLGSGSFRAADVAPSRLADELARLNVAEVVVPESAPPGALPADLPGTRTPRPDWTFDAETALSGLCHHFDVKTLAGYGFDDDQPCVMAAGALLVYLQETLRAGLKHLRRLEPFRSAEVLALDEVTRRSLELTRTLRDGSRDGSLLAAIDRTVTPMGARLLHDWLLAPLTGRDVIAGRHDAVEEFLNDHSFRMAVRDLLGEAYDLQRLTARVSTGRATPRDLGAVSRTLQLLPRLKAKLTSRRALVLQRLESRLELCPDLREALDTALVDDPPLSYKDGGVIRQGYHAELDSLRSIASDGKSWIARFQAQEITRTGINSLKVGFNQVFGYYIEITNTHATRVPKDYIRKQTLKNCERYITPDLKEHEEKVLSAEERSQSLEVELFTALRDRVGSQTHRLLAAAEVLAELDVLAGLAELAASRQYVRPELVDGPVLEITDGRHPVLDQTLPAGTFVPNDVRLSPAEGLVWLITGPNMSGKSVFIRQVATLTLLAQMGSFVPARSARIGLADRVFTRVGASDEMSRGQSTFMVEMTEAANILNNATPRSLVILDEIGRGTSTYDGVSLAWAITEYLHDVVGCRSLFATHYHELAQLSASLPRLRNYNVLVREDADEVLFLHKIAPGSAARSYGIHVARLAGVPGPVLRRAGDVLRELESRHQLPALPHLPPSATAAQGPAKAGPVAVSPPEATPERRPRKKPAARGGPSLFGSEEG